MSNMRVGYFHFGTPKFAKPAYNKVVFVSRDSVVSYLSLSFSVLTSQKHTNVIADDLCVRVNGEMYPRGQKAHFCLVGALGYSF
jgi:hypothetical protein